MTRPERIVHIGLGAFFKAHQAWYTQHAVDSADWGIVAYTGRSAAAADEMSAVDCRYHLLTRSESGDEIESIDCVVRAESGENLADLVSTLSRAEVALVTLTITEAGYQQLDADPSQSALGRLAEALDARRKAGPFPIALVSCDNMPDNGLVLKDALLTFGPHFGPEFNNYLQQDVSFVSTSVDRITPKIQPSDIDFIHQQTGTQDAAAVVTEPFRDWVLSGDFPLGRPKWETAGATFVSEIEAFESRKLWLLNGAHTMLAIQGRLAGYNTVDQAIRDADLLELVNRFWDEASLHLTQPDLKLDAYRVALLERFRNPRIGYRLDQIAQETVTKLKVRIVPVIEQELAGGRVPTAAIRAISGWITWLQAGGAFSDGQSDAIASALSKDDQALALASLLSPSLYVNADFLQEMHRQLQKVTT